LDSSEIPDKKKSKPAPFASSADSVSSAQPTLSIPPLEEWDPKSLPNGFFLIMEGKRRTGKSTFAKWLLQYYSTTFSLVWVMSQTSASGFWQKFVGSEFTFDGWSSSAVNALLERGNKIVELYGEDSPEAKAASALLILDDCVPSELFYDDTFIKLAVSGRHYGISVVFITQDPKTICPKVRDNSDSAAIFNQKTLRNKVTMWEDFMNDVDKDTANSLLSTYAIEHDALMCVQSNLNSVMTKNFYKITGDKRVLEDPDYMLGGEYQRRKITDERNNAKRKKEMLDAMRKGDQRPAKKRIEDVIDSSEYSVEKIFGTK